MSKCWCGGKVIKGLSGLKEVDVCIDGPTHDPFATGKPDKVCDIYVAGPMTGYPDSNYPAFNEAALRLRDVGYFVVNPAEISLEDQGPRHYVDFLREDLKQMLRCSGVAFLDGWWESSGARNEISVAGLLKMPVRSVGDWLERAHQELT